MRSDLEKRLADATGRVENLLDAPADQASDRAARQEIRTALREERAAWIAARGSDELKLRADQPEAETTYEWLRRDHGSWELAHEQVFDDARSVFRQDEEDFRPRYTRASSPPAALIHAARFVAPDALVVVKSSDPTGARGHYASVLRRAPGMDSPDELVFAIPLERVREHQLRGNLRSELVASGKRIGDEGGRGFRGMDGTAAVKGHPEQGRRILKSRTVGSAAVDRYAAAAELNDFKREINLVQFAREQGYEVVRHKSCRSSKCLVHPSGDKIIVARDRRDDHWIYFSVRDDKDKGTIVDFVQSREPGAGIARVRRVLRDWLGRPDPLPSRNEDMVMPVERNRALAAAAYEAALGRPNLRYLNERGLRPQTLSHPQFRDTWRVDPKYGNVLFVHRDAEGISGFEKKNRGFTGFATGGEKTFWYSCPREEVRRLVVAESAIDALSHYQLHPQPGTRYMSFAGELSPRQVVLLKQAAAKLPPSSEVVLAVDNDRAGTEFFEKLRAALPQCQGVAVRRDSPQVGKDWNEVLQAREKKYIEQLPPFQPIRRQPAERALER